MIDSPTIHFLAGVLDDIGRRPGTPNRTIKPDCVRRASRRAAFIAPPELGGRCMDQNRAVISCVKAVAAGHVVFVPCSSTHESVE